MNAIRAVTQGATPTVAVPTSVGFATSPGVVAVEELIGYTTKLGASLYKQGTKALVTPFSMKASQAVIFEKELADWASMMGWDKGMQNTPSSSKTRTARQSA